MRSLKSIVPSLGRADPLANAGGIAEMKEDAIIFVLSAIVSISLVFTLVLYSRMTDRHEAQRAKALDRCISSCSDNPGDSCMECGIAHCVDVDADYARLFHACFKKGHPDEGVGRKM